MREHGWVEFLEDHGENETSQLLLATIEAEAFLLVAVERIGIDWCLDRLNEVKRKHGKVQRVGEIVFNIEADGHSGPPKET